MSDPLPPEVPIPEDVPFSGLGEVVKAGRDQVHLLPELAGYYPTLVMPKSSEVRSLAPLKLAQPRFVTAGPMFYSPDGFIEYMNAFKNPASRIFYLQKGSFVAVIDYHAPVTDASGSGGSAVQARHADHTAWLSLQPSPEWTAWDEGNEEMMDQETFADFIEDHLPDILSPSPGEMLQVANGLQATVEKKVRSVVNRASGGFALQWEEQVEGTVGDTDGAIPSSFELTLRPFVGTPRIPVECRLRFQVDEGNLTLHYKALRLAALTEAAIDAVVHRIHLETGLKPALGSHDAKAYLRGQ